MKKTKILKVLRAAFYCMGFPLLLLVTAIKTMPFFGEPIFKASCANGLLVVFIMWAVVEIIRLIMKFACKKSQMVQTIVTALVGVIVMVVPVICFDLIVGPKIDSAAVKGENYQIAYYVNDDSELVLCDASREGATIVPYSVFDVRYKMLNGTEVETYKYQLGKYVPVTSQAKVYKSLYRKYIDLGDTFMRDYGMNKWINFEDYYFNNYTGIDSEGKPTTTGYLPGVSTTIESEIQRGEKAVVAYYQEYVENGNSEIGLTKTAEYEVAMGIYTGTDAKHVNRWSLVELYEFRDELSVKSVCYPLFVSRNMIYTFMGLVALSTILVGFCSDKLKAIAEGKED